MKPTATGSHQRVRFQKMGTTPPQHCILHGTITAYDFDSGILSAVFDVQPAAAEALTFTPQAGGSYLDNLGRSWDLIN